ncbi:MAG: hypothetical protein MK066_05480 [Crocinitomicaceae bacterium]|nr:hypothetical protein [Crocinitomicaceae bacterium]
MKKILSFLFVAVALISCKKNSAKIDQREIYQKYTVSYDSNTNQTTFVANFNELKESGKSLVLSDNSSITVNGNNMTRTGSNYKLTSSGFITTGTFVFIDNDGNTFTNTASPAEYIANEYEDWINNNYTNYWTWQGGAIAPNEIINLRFVNTLDASQTISYFENTVGQTSLTMTAYSMNGFPENEARAEIDREKQIATGDFNIVGGKIISQYKGLDTYVQFY